MSGSGHADMCHVGLALLMGASSFCASCSPSMEEVPLETERPNFVDVETLTFVHDNGFDGTNWRIVETIPGGLALIDFDGDGWLDVYFTNGSRLVPPTTPARNSLYRNLEGRAFEDVSAASGTDDPNMSLGVCAADVNGDGAIDLYVTNDGPNRLFVNRGGGRFEDVAPNAGVAGVTLDTGCAFFDMDGDGDLDLYVASYVVDERTNFEPAILHGSPCYWPPTNYEAGVDHLYENLGGLTFRDVSVASGIRDVDPSPGLGVISADFNGDGNADLYVANDLSPNFMFLGDGQGHFTEEAFLNGTAFGDEGRALGSMGLDVADYDLDGWLDVVVTNYHDEPNNLYRALSAENYEERAFLAGLAVGGLHEVAWGVGFGDLDHDGLEDLFVANGHLNPEAHAIDDSSSYAQPNRIFRNLGMRFEDVSEAWGRALGSERVSRGAALGDLDNDGDLDIVVSNVGAPAHVLRNDMRSASNWVQVYLEGSGLNQSAIGARVTLEQGGRVQRRERRSSASYLSVHDPRLHFGLKNGERIDRLLVYWPDGAQDEYRDLPVGQLLRVRQGAKEVDVSGAR